jgi:ubiquinone/menaquinone biosynthesis C-methylase UbiE
MKIDYNKASVTYDNTRSSDETVINEFKKKVDLHKVVFLDFGCGTGNYIKKIQENFDNYGYGVEPSHGMREKAIIKNPNSIILEGNHSKIPYSNEQFEFIYLTDVIHHVPDLNDMFREFKRVLKNGGMLCIVTQSWKQIDARWYNRYFPTLSKNEKSRYPDIDTIIGKSNEEDFEAIEVTCIESNPERVVTKEFITNVEEKNFSMFNFISSEELKNGIQNMKKDLGKRLSAPGSGETLVWFRK